ncbi:MAG: hypothetical protein R2911_07655 [Caldilineaceae bacterium]
MTCASWMLDFLRSQVASVMQDVFLFHGTVRQNLLFVARAPPKKS